MSAGHRRVSVVLREAGKQIIIVLRAEVRTVDTDHDWGRVGGHARRTSVVLAGSVAMGLELTEWTRRGSRWTRSLRLSV